MEFHVIQYFMNKAPHISKNTIYIPSQRQPLSNHKTSKQVISCILSLLRVAEGQKSISARPH